MRLRLRTAVTATAVTATVLCMVMPSGAAQATPGSGVSARTIAQTTEGGIDYLLRDVTLGPAGSTGWHYHDGTLYAKVKSGTLTHIESDCSSKTYPAGSSFVEPKGPGRVHIGRNLGTRPVVLQVLYVLPHGSPLSEDAPHPGCA